MNLRRLARLAALCAGVALAVPTVASANEVTKWNEIAMNTIAAQPPLASSPNATMVFAAMVQGAVYSAVNTVDRHGRPSLINGGFTLGSDDAAAATAAFRVLDALFPAQDASLQAAYAASLAAVADGPSKYVGVLFGTISADVMLAQGHDGRTVIGCTFGSGLPGVWQPLAGPTGEPLCDPSAWVRDAKPFVVNSPTQFQSAGPYPLTSAQYAADVNEVESLGAINSTTRTPEQTHAAVFWQSNPSSNYNAVARRFVDQFSIDVSDSARMFALLDLSMADAIITIWHEKYHYDFWRPITAIRHANSDNNPGTVADPGWTPLFNPSLPAAIGGVGPPLNTPPYPDHSSGATAAASAAMHAFASFFGTDGMTFYATSSRFPGDQRTFHRFSDLTSEVLEARIWAGIHFRNADVQAEKVGHDVESYIDTRLFSAAR
jgi:hypothetical protein